MGYYINPPNMTKEEFLNKYGQPFNRSEFNFDSDSLPVCLVQNPGFTAAGICYDNQELEAFSSSDDYRQKIWFTVPKELLKPYYNY